MREYFERFGGVKDVEMIPDKATNRHKGFAFVTFEHEDAVKEVLSRPHELRGKRVSPRGHRLATHALVLTSSSMRFVSALDSHCQHPSTSSTARHASTPYSKYQV